MLCAPAVALPTRKLYKIRRSQAMLAPTVLPVRRLPEPLLQAEAVEAGIDSTEGQRV
jgi:hypothetical protein